jgi:hypothetical protein
MKKSRKLRARSKIPSTLWMEHLASLVYACSIFVGTGQGEKLGAGRRIIYCIEKAGAGVVNW